VSSKSAIASLRAWRAQVRTIAAAVPATTKTPDVPGATKEELKSLAALGGLASALVGEVPIDWPEDVRRWATSTKPWVNFEDSFDALTRLEIDPLAEAYTALISAENRRRLGTVFTPTALVTHMITASRRVLGEAPDVVIDPGAGVGAFTLAAAKAFPSARILAADINPVTLGLLGARVTIARQQRDDVTEVELLHRDFLAALDDLLAEEPTGPVLVLGNPPYTRIQSLPKDYRAELAERSKWNLTSGHANLAVVFQALTLERLRPGDASCMVIPGSVAYTRAARDLRQELWTTPRAVEIERWPAQTRAFIGHNVQAAVVTIGPQKQYRKLPPLRLRRSAFNESGTVRNIESWDLPREGEAPDNWYFNPIGVSDADDSARLSTIAAVRRGVATGANRLFFVENDDAARLPADVLTRGVLSLRFFAEDMLTAKSFDDDPDGCRWLLVIPPARKLDRRLRDYVMRDITVSQRYLCQQRKPWWSITDLPRPSILISPLAKTRFKVVENEIGAVPSNNLIGITPHAAENAPTLARWLRSDAGQAALLRVSRRYHGGSHKIEPGDLRRVELPRL
jgi:adenine-specific DNA-methyltransferase